MVGPDLKPFTKDIGNGSRVKLKVGLYPTKDASGKEMQGAGINALQVLEHKEYIKEAKSGGGATNLSGFEAVKGAPSSPTDGFDSVDF